MCCISFSCQFIHTEHPNIQCSHTFVAHCVDHLTRYRTVMSLNHIKASRCFLAQETYCSVLVGSRKEFKHALHKQNCLSHNGTQINQYELNLDVKSQFT